MTDAKPSRAAARALRESDVQLAESRKIVEEADALFGSVRTILEENHFTDRWRDQLRGLEVAP